MTALWLISVHCGLRRACQCQRGSSADTATPAFHTLSGCRFLVSARSGPKQKVFVKGGHASPHKASTEVLIKTLLAGWF